MGRFLNINISLFLILFVCSDVFSQDVIDGDKSFQQKLDSLRNEVFSPNHSVDDCVEQRIGVREILTPFVFKNSFIKKRFGLDGKSADNEIINQLVESVYFNHYDLLSTTETELLKDHADIGKTDVPMQQNLELTEALAPAPDNMVLDPVGIVAKRPNFWTVKGEYYLQFLQNYVSANWYKGGESNYSALASITLEANYNNKQKVKWDNKLELKLGFLTSKSDSLHSLKTSEDLIRYTGKLGLQASKRWYYTLQLLASTQFYKGYKSNDPMVYSAFAAPLTVNLSFGMDYAVELWEKRLTGNIHIAPVAYNFKYVRMLPLSTRYGLDEGKHTLHDIGSQFTIDLNWNITNNITWKTRLYGFTTYRKAELEWENTFILRFNRFISTNVFIYPRFDDGIARDKSHGYWQMKEFVSLGLNYSF